MSIDHAQRDENAGQIPVKKTVLIVGGGGREHALAWALMRSPSVGTILVAPGNAGLERLRRPARMASADFVKVIRVRDVEPTPEGLRALAVRENVDLTIVGPEGPLAAGIVDKFRDAGLRIFGPTQKAAEIESSKAWSKAFMQRHHIPTARGGAYASYKDARQALDALGVPCVVKASGLAAGKGVFVCETREAAEDALWRLMEAGELGAAGRAVVIEERLVGDEVSVLALTDGQHLVVLPAVRDHKRLKDGDEGPNTGGMGAFLPVPGADQAFLDEVQRTVLEPALAGMRHEGRPFLGCLYAGIMRTADGLRVLEFNARFGDPETQVLMPLLEGDLAEIVEAAIDGHLQDAAIGFSSDACIGVVAAAPGYPDKVQPGSALSTFDLTDDEDVAVFAAGIEQVTSGFVATSGRVLTVTARAPTLEGARKKAYDAVERVAFEGMQFRTDIGASGLAAPVAGAYAAAGVDIEAGNAAVRGMKVAVESTFNRFVLSKFGTFGDLFDAAAFAGMREPVLVASTDGVGTKTMIAAALGRWDTIGLDIVHHSINDILVMGARPLFFLDYVASARIDPRRIATIVGGLAAGCRAHGVALLGGETAEMPGVYREGEVDLAGTIVGVVEKSRIIDGSKIRAGDVVLGLGSNGLHTNGFSLARKVFEDWDLGTHVPELGRTLGDALLAPHRPYLNEITALWREELFPTGLVHITGGGFVENPPRLFGAGLAMALDRFEWSPLFKLIQRVGRIADHEMRRVFNLGIGMLVIVRAEDAARARALVPELKPVGSMVARDPGQPAMVFA